jgi:hypothetical protein
MHGAEFAVRLLTSGGLYRMNGESGITYITVAGSENKPASM